MEPLFINKFKHSKDLYVETNKAFTKLSRFLISFLLGAAYFSLALIFYFWYYEPITSIILAIIGIVFIIYPTARINILAHKREKQMIELYNTVLEAETMFYDDHLFSVGINSKEEINIEYTKIKKVKQSKNLYLLALGNKIVIMVDKNRFEKGNCEEFEKFIAEKSVNAKIRL